MWSAASSWCRVEPSNPYLAQWLGEHLNASWSESGLGGAYNDDLLKLVGPDEYTIASGGGLAELPYPANSTSLVVPYQEAFAAMLAVIARWRGGGRHERPARNMF